MIREHELKRDLKRGFTGIALTLALALTLGLGPEAEGRAPLSSSAAAEPSSAVNLPLAQVSRDAAILTALSRLRGTGAEPALSAIVNRHGRVIFKDLREISKQVKDFDALSWISPSGQWMIFINVKHQSAPPEALAALIAHESLHCDPHNSIEEEIAGWTQEAMTWSELKQRHAALRQIAPGVSPLVDRLNRLSAEREGGTLETLVRNNKGYRNLGASSPGFTPQAASQERRYPLTPPPAPRPAFEMNDPPATFWDS
ncbi:MAG: hypothetical protein IPK79_08265 [Vampirovibrionales bacterium]|nr:hypothetical protein [Vampirovibrionales bacterium]